MIIAMVFLVGTILIGQMIIAIIFFLVEMLLIGQMIIAIVFPVEMVLI
jgi:hypothetical protein